jgi:hypothetical protein
LAVIGYSGVMDAVISAIDAALARKGLSDAAASQAAAGNPSVIKNLRMRQGRQKRYAYHTLKQLADVLGLELYFGPPRPVEQVSGLEEAPATFRHKSEARASRRQAGSVAFATESSDPEELPLPQGASSGAFYVVVPDDALAAAGVPAGAFGLADPAADPGDGQAVHITDTGGRTSLRIYRGLRDDGWVETSANPAGNPFAEALNPRAVARIAPIVSAFRDRPRPGATQMDLLAPDPPVDRHRHVPVLGADGRPLGEPARLPHELVGDLPATLALVRMPGGGRVVAVDTSATEPIAQLADFLVVENGTATVRTYARADDRVALISDGRVILLRPADVLAARPIGRVLWYGGPADPSLPTI